MVMPVLLELVAGVGFLIGGVWYLNASRLLRERQRRQAQVYAERYPRWRWFFYPRWWYGRGLDMVAFRSSAIGMILFGVILFVLAAFTAFHVRS